jgi:copper chaperone CopZ
MNTYKFRTNIKCEGCVATVTPHINNNPDIRNWSVDLADPHKTLTVETEGHVTPQMVKETIEKAGYKAESISE